MKTTYSFTLLLILLVSSAFYPCCHERKKEKFQKVIFGSGGGFTGMVTAFELDSKGALVSESNKSVIKTIKGKQLKEVTKKIDYSNVVNLAFNKPGNFYYFIEVQQKGKTNKVTWTDENKAPEKVIQLYQYLIELTK